MMMRLSTLTLAAAFGIAMGMAGQTAHAACFESGVGCTSTHAIPKGVLSTLSCDALWTVRNSIYHERGYCFRTERAQESFSNEGCYVTDANALRFNSYERTNVSRIVSVEKAKGCR